VPGGVVHDLPSDLRDALSANSTALAAWSDITPLARNEFICWVEDAKQEITRKHRIRRTQEELRKARAVHAAGLGASTESARVGEPRRVVPRAAKEFGTRRRPITCIGPSEYSPRPLMHAKGRPWFANRTRAAMRRVLGSRASPDG
jgi:hypothetical protein